ncbi:serine/threonine protein kinase [Actinocorallia herbida]|uniref:Serine/threonine protein kinase n=1 Tax=Actinocorallia herbida TaxID=58109 RepID=A0A3N1CQG8_9ACTN|nr:serine/threonine-protein kinase [Actinocorallia herbida]ROO83567.1 serine/threonine protein kinase [Actinocorallia herbida]
MTEPLRAGDPESLGPYVLVGRLGSGGMGTVFLADSPDGAKVAVKVINAPLAEDTAFHARFRREVDTARRVRRFCTAPVLDAAVDEAPFYIVTEYVAGPSLDEAIRRDGPLRGADLEGLAVGIATALSAIHDADLVHRDLKPANVLLSAVGPRVIDFGIARAADTGTGVTHTGQLIGTPAYMAPELITGGSIGPASDVFSWACTVAFAATGAGPFDGDSVPQVLYRVVNEPPRLDGLDPALTDLLVRALDKDPARRPTVPALLTALTGRAEPPEQPPAVAVPSFARPAGGGTLPPGPSTEEAAGHPEPSRPSPQPAPAPQPFAQQIPVGGPTPVPAPYPHAQGLGPQPVTQPPYPPAAPWTVPPAARKSGPGALVLGALAGVAVVALVAAGAFALSRAGDDTTAERPPVAISAAGNGTTDGAAPTPGATPEEEQEEQEEAAGAVDASGDVPEAFLGTWQGMITEADGSTHLSSVEITGGLTGGTVGRGFIAKYDCDTTYTLVSASAQTLELVQRSESGLCAGSLTLVVKLTDEGLVVMDQLGNVYGTLIKA